MSLEWFCSAVVVAIGSPTFGHFEAGQPVWRRITRWFTYFGVTALLSPWPGRPSMVAWMMALPVLGASYHLWWCRRYGIHSLMTEPREKYFHLRGWKLESERTTSASLVPEAAV